MKYLLCPPGFSGFLTAIYHSYYGHKDAAGFEPDTAARNFIDEYVPISDAPALAHKVKDAILEKGGADFYRDLYDAYRSGAADREQTLADYIRLFFKRGLAVRTMYGDAAVVAFNDMLRKVRHEVHRLAGFVRFREMQNGAYYAYYSSDNDIVDLLGLEFTSRFSTQAFVLHDYKRGKMCGYDGREMRLLPAPAKVEIQLSERERLFGSLWKQYHKNISVKGRENPRLQRGFLPKKYRHFMSEFDGE
ncbi:MAG: TIGR03915 family putative DNA repair protein [Clostridiales bacterium]|jgi:probable DNA metabolism protein|nr:TIGR03915 family putative DNA repair protein [Clostridiales bacterium]